MTFALTIGNPFAGFTKKWTSYLLQIAIIGLGAGMNLSEVMQAGINGFIYTFFGISLTLLAGLLLGKWLKSPHGVSTLLTAGTAICGGSAIAAIAVTTRAKSSDISMALAIVFTLNAVALFIFPPLGHALGLTQPQFGLLSALAIHDTSSVVGASMAYGPIALALATTVKLTRTLWIIPVALLFGLLNRDKKNVEENGKFKIPWFIAGFLLTSALVTWIPELTSTGETIQQASKRLLVLALLFIGSGLDRSTMKSMGFRPLLQGILLWLLVTAGTLWGISNNWIS
jgi:uncharacterized integral membrane protein (TIGR00698 family)